MPEVLAIKSDLERFDGWINAFNDFDIEIVDWSEIHDKSKEDKSEIDYALVWEPGPDILATFPNLKIIFSVGAGIDHLKGENMVPEGIPVVRMVEDGLTAGMVEYVLYTVLRFHRFMPQYEEDKKNRVWEELVQIAADQRKVGILGLGVLGGACAQALVSLGFDVMGWSRTKKQIEGVRSFHGTDQLAELLEQCDILVSILPLTDQTRGLIDAELLTLLPKGAYLINAGRGPCQVESDIVAALDSGHLAGAALDVYETEPLPDDSPVWDHPKIYFTPHIASMVYPDTSAVHVYDNIVRYRKNQPLTHLADFDSGY